MAELRLRQRTAAVDCLFVYQQPRPACWRARNVHARGLSGLSRMLGALCCNLVSWCCVCICTKSIRWGSSWWARYRRGACLTQEELENSMRGPEFLLDHRYGKCWVVIACNWKECSLHKHSSIVEVSESELCTPAMLCQQQAST